MIDFKSPILVCGLNFSKTVKICQVFILSIHYIAMYTAKLLLIDILIIANDKTRLNAYIARLCRAMKIILPNSIIFNIP